MATSPARLAILFNLYYNGDASAKETDELLTHINNAKNDKQLAALIQEAWENLNTVDNLFSVDKSSDLLDSILKSDHKPIENEEFETEELRSLHWWRYVAAAAVVLISFGVFWKYQKTADKPLEAVARKINRDVPPGSNRAILTLADGSKISLDSATNGLLAQQGSTDVRKTEDGKLTYDTKTADNSVLSPHINLLSTPKGGQYQVVLPDGSKVWLNASSSIRFPAVFSKNERTVEITGEVFFEVAKDKSKPFRVLFGSSEVEVLGTSFNIMAYEDEESSKTTLVEGSVSLRNASKNKLLKPGEQASVLSGGQIVSRFVDVEAAIAWKNGLFYFRDSGIEEVMRQAARWYNIEVKYVGKIPIRQFTGKVSRNVNISELLSMLRYAGVNCRLADNKVIVSS